MKIKQEFVRKIKQLEDVIFYAKLAFTFFRIQYKKGDKEVRSKNLWVTKFVYKFILFNTFCFVTLGCFSFPFVTTVILKYLIVSCGTKSSAKQDIK